MKGIFFCFFVSIALFISCKSNKEREYEIIVQNQTGYKLDELEFSCAIENYVTSVDANSNSSILTLSYYHLYFNIFAEPHICYSVRKYSNQSGYYTNSKGRLASISDLKKNETNYLKIQLVSNPSDSTDIFMFSLND